MDRGYDKVALKGIALALFINGVSGCGQTGPLYLPTSDTATTQNVCQDPQSTGKEVENCEATTQTSSETNK